MIWFDDFSYADTAALREHGAWTLRTAAGHPGVPGARWAADGIALVDDPERPGNRLLRLTARTDGTPAGTSQAQACHRRRALHGTYAARVRFSDAPAEGGGGDPVIQTFYAVGPAPRHDFDPDFSEIDWEYLPQGGWGSPATRLYAIAWQTVRIEPWQAHNAAAELGGRHGGWHQLTVQVSGGPAPTSRWFVDDREVALHGGRNHPVRPMAPSFSLWFSPAGLQPPSAVARVWTEDVDWVLHVPDAVLSPRDVAGRVAALRADGRARVDDLEPGEPAACDF